MPRHLTYAQAYKREQLKGRFWFAGWIIAVFAGPSLTEGGWRVVWFVIVILWILMLFKHYGQDAVRHRAFMNSDSEKPL